MIKPLYICNVKKPSTHCEEDCIHGVPHLKERSMDGNCFKLEELCDCSESKRKVRIKCRKLTNKEMKKHAELEESKSKDKYKKRRSM